MHNPQFHGMYILNHIDIIRMVTSNLDVHGHTITISITQKPKDKTFS